MKLPALLYCCIFLAMMACGDRPDTKPDTKELAEETSPAPDDSDTSNVVPQPADTIILIGLPAKLKQGSEKIGGEYDSIVQYFQPCNQKTPYPVPKEMIEYTEMPNCETGEGPKISLMMKSDSLHPGGARVIQVDTVVNGKAVIVRDGRSDSVQISPKAIERIKEFRRIEGIKKRKAEELKHSQEQ